MIKVIELFSGIGAQAQALSNLGIEYETVAISEIDKYAIQAYELLHGPVQNLGDISTVDPSTIPDCDLMTYSFPCQDISIAGLQKGVEEGSETRSSLLWECKKVIEAKKPRVLLMENVKNLVGTTHKRNFEKWLCYLESLGYKNYWKVLNALDYGVPQNRERVFIVSMLNDQNYLFPDPKERTIKLKDILEPDSDIPDNLWYRDNKVCLKDNIKESNKGLIELGTLDIRGNDSIRRVYSVEGVCPTLTTMTGGNRQPKIFVEDKNMARRLSPKECWRVMGFSDDQWEKIKDHFSPSRLYKLIGNSIAVPCLESIFENIDWTI